MYNDLKNNFLVLKMHQNAPQSMQIFNFFLGEAPHTPPAGGGNPLPHPPHGRRRRPAPLARDISAPTIFQFPPDTFFHFENLVGHPRIKLKTFQVNHIQQVYLDFDLGT